MNMPITWIIAWERSPILGDTRFRVAAPVGRVDRKVDGDPVLGGERCGEPASQVQAGLVRQFVRKSTLNFDSGTSVRPLIVHFDRAPQCSAVARPGGRIVWNE